MYFDELIQRINTIVWKLFDVNKFVEFIGDNKLIPLINRIVNHLIFSF